MSVSTVSRSNKVSISILLLLWLNVIVPSSGQVSLTSSLDAGQQFVCPEKKVSYTCIGSDPLMSLYAPPLLSRNDGASFAITNTPGQTCFSDGPFTATLLSVNPLTGILIIDTSNMSLVNLKVICENGPPGISFNTTRKDVDEADGVNGVIDGSSVSMDGDVNLRVIYSSWVAPSGNFDVDYYEVSVLRNNVQIMVFNTTSTSMTATYTAAPWDTACTRIVVISRCGMRSAIFETNEVSLKFSGSVIFIVVFMVIFIVAFVAVLVALVVVIVKGQKN